MNMNGNLPQKRSFAISLDKNIALILELILLMLAGAFAFFLHAKLRIPLNIPGHHGLEFMAIFTLLRLNSNLKYAATIATIGTGIFLLVPGMGAANPVNSISYLLPGLVLDLLFSLSKQKIRLLYMAAFAAGIAYMSIPLSRLLINLATGYPYMAFYKFGPAYTILSFLFFGMLGGALGFGLNHVKSIFNKDQN